MIITISYYYCNLIFQVIPRKGKGCKSSKALFDLRTGEIKYTGQWQKHTNYFSHKIKFIKRCQNIEKHDMAYDIYR